MDLKRLVCRFYLLLACMAPAQVAASEWVAGAGIQQFHVKLNDGTYSSYGINLNTVRWIKPGIGLSFEAAVPLSSEKSDALTFKVASALATGLRLESGGTESKGTTAHVTTGVSLVNLDVETTLETHKGNYSGIFFKGGLSFPAKFNTVFSIDYLHHWLDGDLTLDGFSLSIRREL